MKTVMSIATAVLLVLGAGPSIASGGPGFQTKIVEHGGGCRKSSPPGQCCHMDRKTGLFHCH